MEVNYQAFHGILIPAVRLLFPAALAGGLLCLAREVETRGVVDPELHFLRLVESLVYDADVWVHAG